MQLSAQQTYQLVWSDEFDSTAIDTTKWSFQIGDGTSYELPPGWGNGELEWYLVENATVANGFLSITAKEEQIMEYDYTSARLRTKNKGDWTYGRFEMSAKLPLGKGLWPAFWMFPTEEFYGGWAASGELDIMELIGSVPDSVFGTIHYGGSFPANIFTSEHFVLPTGQTFADTFHVFAVEWEYGEIRWFVDDSLYATQTDWYSTAAPFPAPFDRDFHILLNVAVGGTLPGPPDSTTIFPQTMMVDYVRVYQAVNNTAPDITIITPPNGASFPSGSDIHITVDANDTTGNIQKVLFFQGDAQLGENTQSPYEYTVSNVSAGCYTIIAKAIDDYGAAAFDSVSIIVDSCIQAPYLMVPAKLPGVIEAENYDIGGQGVAYNDIDPGINNGNAFGNEYRVDEGVDILYNMDNRFGYHIDWIENGEWLEYQVNVQSSDAYTVDLRIASESNGGSLYIEFDGVDKTGLITFAPTGGWQDWVTVRTENISLDSGVQTMRIVMTDSAFILNHIEFQTDTSIVVDSLVIFDDFEDGDISDWSFFPGNNASGSGTVISDQPAEGTYYLSTDWSGTGSNSFFYGGFFKNLDNSAQIVLPESPWINIYLYNESITSVDEYAFEITIREDTDGNGWTNGQEDSKRLDTYFSTSDFNDRWILVSAPVDSFLDIGTGGNGFFDGKLDELVIVVSQVMGDNPSDVNVDMDFIAFSQGGPLETIIFEDFEDGDISDWSFFPGNTASGSGTVLDDRPAEGTYYLSTDWSGSGSNSFFYGGFFKNLDNSAQIDLPDNPWINIYLYNESTTSVNEYAFEITIREDTDGNGWTNGQEDSKRLDTYFSTSDFNDRWIWVSAPIDSFMDIGTGGNGFFDGKLDELVIVVSQVVGDNPSDVNVDMDFITFSRGPSIPLVTGLNVINDQIKQPDKYELYFAYPNPFNPSTTITYYLPKQSQVNIDVFNTIGEKVKTLVNDMQSAGKYKVIFDARDLASGVYFYQLRAGSFVETKKMMMMK
jgi:beta-glucanase (GH16 family)